ncbi:hypothetical protein [Terracoccus sp. 273MFTsu3.1]|uniref:hypothetical protein n=1 Tax=Terracoccus sp. 273MFTsu3.1 TaxID=1172188 RepID=UPI00035DAA1A|nr:hypothetical protein [Terracoccus sp. 273MFTsu3.1]
MGDIIIPAGAKTAPMPDLNSLPEADLDALAAKVNDEETYPQVRTAFAVVIGLDGQISLDPSLVKNVRVMREPHNDDVIGALAALQTDVQTSLAAVKTAQIMQQQAMAMQEQMREQQMHSRVQQALSSGKR